VKVLVTGSAGMLGRDICQRFSDTEENQVCGLDNRASAQDSFKILEKFVDADITKENELIEKIGLLKPELVIHTAAYADVDGCELDKEKAELVNAVGTKNVALACKDINAALFYISTDYVFPGREDKPYAETDEPDPVNVYGRSKLNGEKYIKAVGGEYLIIRSSWLFGRYGKNFVDTVLAKAAEKINSNNIDTKELKIVADQTGSPTYTKDLADAIERLTRSSAEPRGIYHITNSGSCSWHKFASEIVKCADIKNLTVSPITTDELKPPRPAQRPSMSALDNARYNNLANCPLRSWQEALGSYIKTKMQVEA